MDNKKYLDKVIGSLVRGTKIDYEEKRIHFPFFFPPPFLSHLSRFLPSYSHLIPLFSKYCKDTFGLTKEEIDYVWKEYKYIITDKISKREP